MQKIFILLKTVVSIIFLYLISAAASASTILIDSLTYTIDPDGTASVTQCNKTHEGSLSIPSSFEFDGTTYSVIAIEAWAFSNCSLLTEVITPESITTIGEWAFSSSSITNITLGENITSIGNYAFDECPNLNGINVNENNSFYKDINGVLFSKDGTLLIQYPMGKTDSSYSIPERVVTIGNDAFRCCDSLSEIIIPDSVIEIGEWAFDSCKSLKYIAIPNSVIRIGTGCFNACTSLTHITIPDSVISIGNSIFYDCTRLSSVSLGNGITEVKSSTFYNCFSLKSVILGNHITQIGNNVFRNCSKLAHIYFKSHTPPTIGTYTFINCPYNIICYYPQGSKSEWGSKWLNFNTQSWNPFYPLSFTIVNNTALISDCDTGYAGAISIPSFFEYRGVSYPITSIGYGAFSYCSELTEIVIHENISSIEEGAFSYCTALNTIRVDEKNPAYKTIEDVLYSIDGTLLHTYPIGKTNVSYTLPDSVIAIGNNAFTSSSKLAQITIGNGISSIGDSAFSDCSNLTEIYFKSPAPPLSTGIELFYNCSNIVIYYPEVFEANWDSSWQGFPTQPWTYPLTYTINDDETVSVVDCDSDYSGSVQIPSHTTYEGITRTVTSIKSNAFSDCPLLIDLIIPDTISMIEDEAFAYSSNLSGIYFKSHIPPSIGNEAFSGCPSNMILYYPEGSENEWPSSLQDFPTQSWNSFYPLTLAIINDTATIIDCAPDYSGIVTIPASIKYSGTNYNITSIEADAFLNSPLITRFYVDKDQAVYKDIEGILFSKDETKLIQYPSNNPESSCIIPNSVSLIGKYAFSNNALLTEIYFQSENPPSIETNAFYNCLNKVIILYPNGFGNNWGSEWEGFNTFPWNLDGSKVILSLTIDNQTRFYNTENPILTYNITETTGTLVNVDGKLSLSTDAVKESNIGEYEIYITENTLDNNFDYDIKTGILNIIPIPLTVAAEDKTRPYKTENPELTYLITDETGTEISVDGLPELSTAAELTSPIGEYPITAAQGSLNTNYTYTFTEGTLTVTPIPLTVAAEDKTRPYKTENPELTYLITDETGTEISVDGLPELSTAAELTSPVGEYPITAAQGSLNTNYTYTFTEGTLTVTPIPLTVAAEDKTRPYKTENPELTYLITDETGTEISVDGLPELSTPAELTSPIGEYPITAAQGSLNTNYTYTFTEGTLTVTPIPLTVAAEDKTRPYKTENPELTYLITDETGTEISVDGLPELSTAAELTSPIGEYPITAAQGSLNTNYTYTFTEGTLTVTPIPLTVAAEDKTRPYKTENPELTYLITDETGTEISVDGLPELSTAAELTSPVGEYPITAAQGSLNTNYTYTFTEGTLTVTPIPLTVAAEDKTRPYKTENPELTYLITDETGTEISVDGLPELSTPAELTSPIGEYPITAAQGTLDTNYTYKFIDAILTITYVDPLTYTLDEANATASVTDCETDYPGYVIIPSTIERDGKTYTVTSIGDYAFWWCTLISEIIIPEGIITVGNNAFSSCTSLTEIIFPDSVISIGEKAFYQCSSLTSAYLGSGISEIGEDIFIYSPMLNEILVSENNTHYQDKEGVLYSKDGTLLISYPRGKSDKSYTIPDEVTEIAANAFFRCDNLTQIIMPENITTIGDKAFYNFPSLNEIYFKSIAPPTDLGGNMFLGCSPHIIIYYPAGFEYSWGPTWLGFKTQPWGTFEEATIKILKIETNHETGEINLTLIFTGILEESTDGISWLKMTEVQSPYTVTIKKNQNRLFRSKFKWSASLSNSN